MIRNLDGRATQRGEKMKYGKAYIGDRQKANQFGKVYKKVSRIKRDPEDKEGKGD